MDKQRNYEKRIFENTWLNALLFEVKVMWLAKNTIQSLNLSNYLWKRELLARYLILYVGNQSNKTRHNCSKCAYFLRNTPVFSTKTAMLRIASIKMGMNMVANAFPAFCILGLWSDCTGNTIWTHSILACLTLFSRPLF